MQCISPADRTDLTGAEHAGNTTIDKLPNELCVMVRLGEELRPSTVTREDERTIKHEPIGAHHCGQVGSSGSGVSYLELHYLADLDHVTDGNSVGALLQAQHGSDEKVALRELVTMVIGDHPKMEASRCGEPILGAE